MSDLDRYQYGYDQDSNRLYKANTVGTAAVGNLDEGYTYDPLNRLTQMQRGTLTGGPPPTGIGGTPVREMDYGLDITGNWSTYQTKTSGTTDLNQTRTSNTVNEITAIGGTPGWATPPSYDASGNMTSFPQPGSLTSSYTATYDAWNRLTSVSNTSGTVATYSYDGRNRRIVKVTTATSETRHFYYSNAWQDIEERTGTSTTADKQYVWGIRYVDELVCRDDATPQRLYAFQDANFNLTAICDTSATVQERYIYDPYGNRTIYSGSWGSRSSSAYAWVVGHQGLMNDVETGLIYNRNRMLHPGLGMWLQRDSIKYKDSMNLYQYCRGNPLRLRDPMGLADNSTPPWKPGDPIPYFNPDEPLEPLDPEGDAAIAALEDLLWGLSATAAAALAAAAAGAGCGYELNKHTRIDDWLGNLLYDLLFAPSIQPYPECPPCPIFTIVMGPPGCECLPDGGGVD